MEGKKGVNMKIFLIVSLTGAKLFVENYTLCYFVMVNPTK